MQFRLSDANLIKEIQQLAKDSVTLSVNQVAEIAIRHGLPKTHEIVKQIANKSKSRTV